MRLLPAASVILIAAVALAAGKPARPPAPGGSEADSFPHARHARLFTSCEACHNGLSTDDSTAFFPAPEVCQACHDGVIARRVSWARGARRPSLAQFSHSVHPPIDCASCHASSDTAALMDVGRAIADRCLLCHAPDAANHLEQQTCDKCHRTLAATPEIPLAQIARFPRPPSHDTGWTFAHQRSAGGGTCATCHAREFCASCHVNAASLAAVRELPADARVATLARARRVRYRAPDSHGGAAFLRGHGLEAHRSAARCANCHARESCLTCHRQEERVAAVSALPRRTRGGARGVDLGDLRPPDHAPDFQLRHRTAAAGGDATCGRCHSPSFCADCHAGRTAPGFHGSNFVERHSQNAFARENDCSACHQTESFCVSCHRLTGRAEAGATLGRFHDARPLWIFAHGGVARRAIESCAGCHAQSFCLTCHSASRGWGVNPHGPGFDPAVESRNPALCRRCHLSGAPRR
jgi:hypothetical protein